MLIFVDPCWFIDKIIVVYGNRLNTTIIAALLIQGCGSNYWVYKWMALINGGKKIVMFQLIKWAERPEVTLVKQLCLDDIDKPWSHFGGVCSVIMNLLPPPFP